MTCSTECYLRAVDDLVGTHEIAKALGVNQTNVQRWVERRQSTNCPRPVKQLRLGALYSMAEWRHWFKLWTATRTRFYDKTQEAPP